MSFQAASGAFPTQPTSSGGYPGPGGAGVFSAAPVPVSAVYPTSAPPGGMFPMAGPHTAGSPGMMRPPNAAFPVMHPGMGQPGILPMPPMPPGGTAALRISNVLLTIFLCALSSYDAHGSTS